MYPFMKKRLHTTAGWEELLWHMMQSKTPGIVPALKQDNPVSIKLLLNGIGL
jgi:hypothetical protein